jgi:hypothetical protein
VESKFQTLASECQNLLVVTGDAAQGRFELKALTGSLEDAAKCDGFIGMVGFAGLIPKLALAFPITDAAADALAMAVTRLIEEAMERVEYWLENDFQNPPVNGLEGN